MTAALGGARIELVDAVPPGRGRPVLDASHLPVPRRALLLLPRTGTPALPPEGLSPHRRFVAAARALAARAPETDLSAVPAPGALLRAAGCVACGVCVRACPEEALTLTDATPADGEPGHGAVVLRVNPARCSGCGICVDRCDPGALRIAGPLCWEDVLQDREVELARVNTATCSRCGGRVPAGDTLCAVCEFRRSHPFGSTVPPGSLRTSRAPGDRA